MKKKSTLKKTKKIERLGAYSALAVAFIAGGTSESEAQIVYTDLDPDLLLDVDTFAIDFDDDGLNDIIFGHNYLPGAGGNGNARMWSDNLNVQLIGASGAGGAFFYPFVLAENDIIGSSASGLAPLADFNGGVATLWWQYVDNGPPGYGYWAGQSGYVGLEFQSGSTELHYAWVELEMTDQFDAMEFTIKGYAFQSTPETAIAAGDQGSVGISENLSNNSRIFSHNGIVNIQLNNMTDFKGYVSIKDITGKEVYNDQMNGLTNEINLQSEATGVYFVQLFGNDGYTTKKVYLSEN